MAGTAQPFLQNLLLDPALFYWIVLPIAVVMILTGILRHYAMTLLQGSPKSQTIPVLRLNLFLNRISNLRTNGSVISLESYQRRKAYMLSCCKSDAFITENDLGSKPESNPMSDPAMMEGMFNMMKNNAVMMVPQTLIMSWINAFFSGFIIMKLPFPLTPQFKSMLQSGVGTRDLDVRWVSSLSWYFLTLFGLQPVYSFILGDNSGSAAMTPPLVNMNATNPTGADKDPKKLLLNEAENLELFEQQYLLQSIEERLMFPMKS